MENEKQFHLGFLPTEQSNPMTKHLDAEFAAATTRGVSNLQSVDRKVLEMAQKVFASKEFAKLVDDALATIKNGGKIVFSGCGATGRLSILLECMWRNACVSNAALAKYANCVFSIMTGGDYALVRSVEFFEDYLSPLCEKYNVKFVYIDNGYEYLLGDTDSDGVVDASDASRTLEAYAMSLTGSASNLSISQTAAADANGDSTVNSVDASYILNYYSHALTGGNSTFEKFIDETFNE